MIVILVSLVAAAVQMGLLLLTARILGSGAYAQFSMIIAAAVFLSAAVGEWLRMVVARQGGTLRLRIRGALLAAVRRWTLTLAGALAAVGMALKGLDLVIPGIPGSGFLLAATLAASGNMLSDMAATHLRFTSTRAAYNRYALARSAVVGCAAVLAACAGATGAEAAIAFGVAGCLCGGGYVGLLWRDTAPARSSLLVRFAPVGWSMASASIGTTFALTASRLAIGIALPASVSAGTLLAIDLASRGTNVLATAMSTWGNRLIYSGAHEDGDRGARAAFTSVSAVFISIWFSVAIIGLLACVAIPLVTLHVAQRDLYFVATAATLSAILLLLLRAMLFDAFLAALHRQRDVALAALTSAIVAAIGAGLAFIWPVPELGIAVLPMAVLFSFAFYLTRSGAELWIAIDHRSVRFALAKTAVAAVIAWLAASGSGLAGIAAVLLVAIALDIRCLLQLYRRFRTFGVAPLVVAATERPAFADGTP